jgi:hypothetical protein
MLISGQVTVGREEYEIEGLGLVAEGRVKYKKEYTWNYYHFI